MAPPETVLVVNTDGSAVEVPWPAAVADRPGAITAALGGSASTMRRCGKGILAFSLADGDTTGLTPNPFATAAFVDQDVALAQPLSGPVLFARNPSKGSTVMALTAAQAANLLVITGAVVDEVRA